MKKSHAAGWASEKKGSEAFWAFLDKELPPLGLAYWRAGDEYGGYYCIGVREKKSQPNILRMLFLFEFATDRVLARIIAMPCPERGAEGMDKEDVFRIRVFDREVLPKLRELAEKFAGAGFSVPLEIID